MEQDEFNQMREALKEQTAMSGAMALLFGAIASVMTDEQFQVVVDRYVQDAKMHTKKVSKSPRPDAMQWATAMQQMQQGLIIQVIELRKKHLQA